MMICVKTLMRNLSITLLLAGLLGAEQDPVKAEISSAADVATLQDGFLLEHVFEVPENWGSWVSLAALPNEGETTRIAAGDQYGDIYEIKVSGENISVAPLEIELKGAHGLLWFQDSLYVVVGESVEGGEKGVYRARDLDGNGSFEDIQPIRIFQSGGEHGVHSLVPSPDGEWLYFIAGNYTQEQELDGTQVPKVWDEDQLLPRNPDGRGHASDKMAPGGKVLRFRPDGSQWEYYSTGYRNPFDAAFNEYGDLFVYDADMEWDMGMPWYRPTRLCWAMPGSEFGWRNGTGKWPVYYEDSLPGVVDFGPGSPVGTTSGQGAKFPAKYQRAIYCFDWTFATIYASHITPEGHGYTGEWEEFLTAKALPLTDGVVGLDGNMYFATGGRRQGSNLWRIRYDGSEKTEDAWRSLEKPEGKKEDRWSRFARRIEAEMGGAEKVRALVGKGSRAENITAVMGLARVGTKEDRSTAMQELLGMPWDELSKQEKLSWLRALGLVFIRTGEPSESERADVLAKIDAHYPNSDREVEDELCRMLCYLQAPKVVERTLLLLAQPRSESEIPDWTRLIERSQGNYGANAAKVMRELGSPRKIHFAYCLRVVKGPWTPGQRRQLMDWYAREENGKAQKSASLGLKRMREDTLANATEEERALIESWGLEVKRDPFADLPVAKGPGRTWTIDEVAALAKDLTDADVKNGEKMFQASLCAACHRVGRMGGAAGPDLSNVAGRFNPRELAVAILDPNREISDQYGFQYILKTDGSTVMGKVLDEKDEILVVATNPFDFSETQGISRADIKEMKPSPVSPMPGALINQLNEKELKDFLGFLLGTE